MLVVLSFQIIGFVIWTSLEMFYNLPADDEFIPDPITLFLNSYKKEQNLGCSAYRTYSECLCDLSMKGFPAISSYFTKNPTFAKVQNCIFMCIFFGYFPCESRRVYIHIIYICMLVWLLFHLKINHYHTVVIFFFNPIFSV